MLACAPGAAGAETGDQVVPRASDYDACLAAARDDAETALLLAGRLDVDGRDRAAVHCRALALSGLDRPAEAAQAMLSLAQLLEEADADRDANGAPAPLDQTAPPGETAASRFRLQAARLLARAGEPSAARDVLGDLLATPATPSEAARSAAMLAVDLAWADGDLAVVEDALDRAAQVVPDDDPEIIVRRAALLRAQGDPQGALDLLARQETATPPAGLLLERGLANVDTGRLPAARADWIRLIALYPESAAAEAARRNLDRLDDAVSRINVDDGTLPPSGVRR